MAYSHTLHFSGASGRKSQESGQEYEAIYRVITDSAQDQAEKVIAYFTANVVDIGDTYEYANDSDTGAVAKVITPKREKNSLFVWVVRVQYSPPGSGEFSAEFIQEEPELRCEDVSMQTIQHQKPVETAIYRSGFVGTAAAKIAPNSSIIPQNSAFTPFNPGLEKDSAGLAVRVVRRLPAVNGTSVKTMMNSVNSEAFSIDHCFFQLSVEKYQARIVSANLALRSDENGKYWELPIVMEIIDEGWREFIVDRGTHARAIAGDPDGRGSFISAGDPAYNIAGVPRTRELVDTDETPISDPVLFDGDGQPLDLSTTTTPVLLEYSKYLKEVDFRTVLYLQGFAV